MKKRIFGAFALSIALVAGTASASASANEGDINHQVEDAFATQLEQRAEAAGMQVTIDDVTVRVSPELVEAVGTTDADAIATYLLTDANKQGVQQDLPSASAKLLNGSASPLGAAALTSSSLTYTTDQITLPFSAAAWVKQDERVYYSGSKISSVSLLGKTYQTGVTVFAWDPIRTWTQIKRSSTCVATHMKGTMGAVVKGSFITTDATFLASNKLSSGRMVGVRYDQC